MAYAVSLLGIKIINGMCFEYLYFKTFHDLMCVAEERTQSLCSVWALEAIGSL